MLAFVETYEWASLLAFGMLAVSVAARHLVFVVEVQRRRDSL
jgi:hypothetical protein